MCARELLCQGLALSISVDTKQCSFPLTRLYVPLHMVSTALENDNLHESGHVIPGTCYLTR